MAQLEGKHLSARWMVLVAVAFLAWVSLMPVAWISWLMIKQSLVASAVKMIVCGLLVCFWNLYYLQSLLFGIYQQDRPRTKTPRTGWQMAGIFGVQILLAFVCTHLAGSFNPVGMQQWFWMPVAGFAGVLLTRRSLMILVLLVSLVISTVHEYIEHGPQHAAYWICGQLTTSVFIMGCCFAMAQASRQRMNTERLAVELRTANAQLELQADQAAVSAVAQERNRLAREIHAAVGHSMAAVGVQLDAAESFMPQTPVRALDSIHKAQRASREGLAEIRRSAASMRASQEERSLTESLTSLITGAERPGLKLTLQQSGKSRSLPPLVEMSLFRCAQEGIANACRHSGASEITVHLDYTSSTRVVLSVTDNGRGFSKVPENSHGLKGLFERAVLLRGEFTAGTDPQGGGCCRMEIPA